LVLQSLYDLYGRLLDDPESGVSKPGYSKAQVSFAFNLCESGELLDVIDVRDASGGKKLRAREMDVPRQVKRTSGVSANFLCDNSGYVIGAMQKRGKELEITTAKHDAMRTLHDEVLEGSDDPGARAVLAFLHGWDPARAQDCSVLKPLWKDIVGGGSIVFKLDGTTGYIHNRPSVRRSWEAYCARRTERSEGLGYCLVTGEIGPIARVHDSVKGVAGAQTSGAALVSFNAEAFKSYKKDQSINAPVSEEAAFGYVTALNYLLRSRDNRMRIADSTTVFWAEGPARLEEEAFAELVNPSQPGSESSEESSDGEASPDSTSDTAPDDQAEMQRDPRATRLIHDVLAKVAEGRPAREGLSGVDPNVRFCILGLSPNNARVSVRFWYVSSFGALVDQVAQHYADMSIVLPTWETGPFPIWRVIKATAPLGDLKRASPLLAGAITRSMLMGIEYPEGLYTALLARIRADQDVSPVQAAMIKACLVRRDRLSGKTAKEGSPTVSLNEQCTDSAYLLGRLFAWLERVQANAAAKGNPEAKLQSTIRDRYFGSASATPRSVFPMLLRLAQHHIAKADYGEYADKQIEGIIGPLDGFPAYLDLEQQGEFILGYYHQRQAFYEKKPAATGSANVSVKEEQR